MSFYRKRPKSVTKSFGIKVIDSANKVKNTESNKFELFELPKYSTGDTFSCLALDLRVVFEFSTWA